MDEVRLSTYAKGAIRPGAKAVAKAGLKAAAKVPRSRYHLFLREQLGKMTGEDRKNYCSIASGRCKKTKEDHSRLIVYNNSAK